ncbi:hypothetical protein [Microbacterium immunditiarum]|uniref:Uncharacterized protein n=1 Tax=Microbacterium immunditiarum TaxID=337480 RepID=A0A7Y9GPB8_9MICO|nr:hypothetical protein [Microbacterium immunditiarum]NYE20084.1 hypothetical protein [Microbacterium immunditiarum]
MPLPTPTRPRRHPHRRCPSRVAGSSALWRRIPRWAIAVVGVLAGAAAGVGFAAAAAAQPERWLNGGCAPDELGAVFDINDDYGLQEIADPDLPEGSTIRLVLDGDLVEVWIHEGDGPTRVFER